jgi:hypothetical protein
LTSGPISLAQTAKNVAGLLVSRLFHRLPALVPPGFRQVIEKALTELSGWTSDFGP